MNTPYMARIHSHLIPQLQPHARRVTSLAFNALFTASLTSVRVIAGC